jgi:hypothetical protein
MAKAKTPKQLNIKIMSLKKQVTKLEGQRKRAIAAAKKKPKKKAAKKRTVKKKTAKRRTKKRR